jgi:hypothetical protein
VPVMLQDQHRGAAGDVDRVGKIVGEVHDCIESNRWLSPLQCGES